MKNSRFIQGLTYILTFGIFFVGGVVCAYIALEMYPTLLQTRVHSQVSCSSFPSGAMLEESESATSSTDTCWWLNSGAYFFVDQGAGLTLHGALSPSSKWLKLYAVNNPVDTDQGNYPQNIFRLINMQQWQDMSEEVFFTIDAYHESLSLNRNMTNGVFLLGRYKNADNLYLAGIRVDNTAVIKRKLHGVYETLASVSLDHLLNTTATSLVYDRKSNPILLPMNHTIGLAMEISNQGDSTVLITLKISDTGHVWTTILSAADSPSSLSYGRDLLTGGNAGIRTDFMDVSFKDYSLTTLTSQAK